MISAALSLLCLVAVSHSAPLTCQELVRPLERLNLPHLEGKWALVAGSLSHLPFLERFKQRDSASVSFHSNTSETHMTYTRSISSDNKCQYNTYNITLNGTSFTYDGTSSGNFSANFARTSCRDCILMHMRAESGERQHFYLFSRRRQLDQTEMEEFSAQVECLNMPPPAVMDPTKALCPEEAASDAEAQPEEKTEGRKN